MKTKDYLKMMDFSNPKPNFNYALGWKDTPIKESKKQVIEEVSLRELQKLIKIK